METRRKLGKPVYSPVTEIVDLPQSVDASLSEDEHVTDNALLLHPTADSSGGSLCLYLLKIQRLSDLHQPYIHRHVMSLVSYIWQLPQPWI